MIAIDANLYLLCNMFNISSKKLSEEYSGMTIDEIMKAEAAQGNAAAANFDLTVLKDPAKLVKLFELNNPNNKFIILNSMSEKELEDLLPMLDQHDLAMGLNYFTKDKLLNLFEKLPKKELLKLTFAMFTPEQVMKFMPEEQLDKFLMSDELDKGMEMKFLATMKPEVLAQMLAGANANQAAQENNSGAEQQQPQAGLNRGELLAQISELPDDKFQEAMLAMPKSAKRSFIYKMTQEDPKLFRLFDSHAYVVMMSGHKEKGDMVKAATVLKPESLCKMLEKLPKSLTAVVLTQMDTAKFADLLLSKFRDVLGQIVAA